MKNIHKRIASFALISTRNTLSMQNVNTHSKYGNTFWYNLNANQNFKFLVWTSQHFKYRIKFKYGNYL